MKDPAHTLSLMHINDTHSYFDASVIGLTLPFFGERILYIQCGGFAHLSWAIEQHRAHAKKNRQSHWLLHAGDTFQGSLYFSLFKGEANATLLNALQIDAMALGNHELDMGNDLVGQFLRRVNFPILAGNWDLSHENNDKKYPLKGANNLLAYDPQTQTAKYQIKMVNKHPIALFGVTLDDMEAVANPDSDTPFHPVQTLVENTIAAIQAQGIHTIVLLSHLGYERDCQLAQQVDGLSVIVGGHSHTFQGDFSALGLGKKDQYGQKFGDTTVVQAGCHALMLGCLNLHFDKAGRLLQTDGKNTLLLSERLSWDAKGEQPLSETQKAKAIEWLKTQPNVLFCQENKHIVNILAERYQPAIAHWEKEVLAEVMEPLRHVRIPDKQGGSKVAPLVAESFLWQARQMHHRVDFAIHNAGGVRASLNAGPLTQADVAGRILPFSMTLGIYAVKGKFIRAALEGAINNAIDNGVQGTGTGSFPYVAGLRFQYCCNYPMGERITQLDWQSPTGWQALEDERVYHGISSSYTVQGKEGYSPLLHRESEVVPVTISMADAFAEYAKAHPQLRPIPVTLEQIKWCR